MNQQDQQRLAAARTAYRQKRVAVAVESYEDLLKSYPHHLPLVAELTQIYLRFERRSQAEPLLRRLLGIGRNDLPSLLLAGAGFKRLGLTREAIQAFRLALAVALHNSTPAESQSCNQVRQLRCEIATLSERINDLPALQFEVAALLALQNPDGRVLFLAGLSSARTKQFDEAIDFFQRSLEQPELSAEFRCQIEYELAQVLDAKGDYAAAFDRLVSAKQIDLSNAAPEKIKAAWMARLMIRLTAELRPPTGPVDHQTNLQSKLTADNFGRPLCLLTGHPRSGTTLLEQLLNRHSKICSADESSSFFHTLVYPLVFPTSNTPQGIVKDPLPELTLDHLRLSNISPAAIQTAIAAYRDELERLTGDRQQQNLLIDKNPGSLIDLPIYESALPQTKVLVVLRDPRDVCLSCFQQFLGANLISVNFDTLENTARKIVRDLEFWFTLRRSIRLDWLEVRYERLVAQPEFELKRVVEFLGYDWEPNLLNPPQSLAQPQVFSPSYRAVARPVYQSSIGRWQNYAQPMQAACEILHPLLAEIDDSQ